MLNKKIKTFRISIIIKPRLHITLIGMDLGGYRINGGAGFAIDAPLIQINAARSRKVLLLDKRINPFSKVELMRIKDIIVREKHKFKYGSNIAVNITGKTPTHFGFGSSTAVRLGCLEALHILNGRTPKAEEIIESSGRGGTSGIGITSYFNGGFVVDLGKKCAQPLLVSSHQNENRTDLPLLLKNIKMPMWEIGICVPRNIKNMDEKDEREFFRKTCPIASKEVYKTLYHVIYGLYAAISEKDKLNFCKAIKNIQTCKWKMSERNEYGNKLRALENILYKNGALCVGMSSLGPALFFLAKNVHSIIDKMNKENRRCDLFVTKPSNKGRILFYV